MAPFAYYNEIDPFAASWLEALIAAKQIADGVVDTRSILDVDIQDLDGFTQCHFFAGIGGWSLALRLAGWPDDREVWTGSCPCQPFSAAGKQEGMIDDRHLWPTWANLIALGRPPVVFGEQVEAAIRHGWLDLVQDDLEDQGYAFAAVGLPAACVGAPHIRQRLWFVADADVRVAEHAGLQRGGEHRLRAEGRYAAGAAGDAERAEAGELADRNGSRRAPGRAGEARGGRDAARIELAGLRDAGELVDTDDAGPQGRGRGELRERPDQRATRTDGASGPLEHASGNANTGDTGNEVRTGREAQGRGKVEGSRDTEPTHAGDDDLSFWANAIWIPCSDGKARPVEPTIFPLASGIQNRVGLLRGAGNSIVPQVAAELIRAYLDVTD